jgi:hypothetical protein
VSSIAHPTAPKASTAAQLPTALSSLPLQPQPTSSRLLSLLGGEYLYPPTTSLALTDLSQNCGTRSSVRVFEEEGDCIVCLEMRADELIRRLISGELTNYSVVRTSPEPLHLRLPSLRPNSLAARLSSPTSHLSPTALQVPHSNLREGACRRQLRHA